MPDKKYVLSYGDVVVCKYISLDYALVLIEALCRKYYKEGIHKFQLVEEQCCMQASEADMRSVNDG